jgi:hypothetical protein
MNVKTIAKVWEVVEPKFQREFDVRQTLSVLTHDTNTWGSWGVNLGTIKNLGGKCMIFKPNGRYFKGFVCITLGWEDLYQVHFVSNSYKLKKSVEGVYFDDLVITIDNEVELR